MRSGERCKLSQWDLGQSPSRQRFGCIWGRRNATDDIRDVHFSVQIFHAHPYFNRALIIFVYFVSPKNYTCLPPAPLPAATDLYWFLPEMLKCWDVSRPTFDGFYPGLEASSHLVNISVFATVTTRNDQVHTLSKGWFRKANLAFCHCRRKQIQQQNLWEDCERQSCSKIVHYLTRHILVGYLRSTENGGRKWPMLLINA